MPPSVRVAIVAAGSFGVLGLLGFLSGVVEALLYVAAAGWIVRGTLKRDSGVQDQALAFGALGAVAFGAAALTSVITTVLGRSVWSSETSLFLAPFVALTWSLSRVSASRWFLGGTAPSGRARGASPFARA